jgi:hypothetical protein
MVASQRAGRAAALALPPNGNEFTVPNILPITAESVDVALVIDPVIPRFRCILGIPLLAVDNTAQELNAVAEFQILRIDCKCPKTAISASALSALLHVLFVTLGGMPITL